MIHVVLPRMLPTSGPIPISKSIDLFRFQRDENSTYSYSPGPNYAHLKNWVTEGSADGKSWSEIDRRENNTDLNSSSAIKTFDICKVDTFRMIQLRRIGVNHCGNDFLSFTAFELFGSLIGLE
jgi:hypothetical protein